MRNKFNVKAGHERQRSSNAKREQFAALCREGKSREAIAGEMNIEIDTIREYARGRGIPLPHSEYAVVKAPNPPRTRTAKFVNSAKILWDEPLVQKLRQLWADPTLSASQIATRLGANVTRNAVIGKVHRLGLAGRTQRGGRKIPQPSQAELDAAALAEETAEAERRAKIAAAREMTEARRQAKAARIALEAAKPIAVIAPVSPAIALEPPPVDLPKVLEFPKTPEPEPKGISIFELRDTNKERGIVGTCRYPLGARLEFAERFCGKPVRNGRPYCPECCSVAFVPMKRRIFAPIAKHNTASQHRVFDVHTN